nr:hypothetical protein CFP56_15423 [Quercus suber]
MNSATISIERWYLMRQGMRPTLINMWIPHLFYFWIIEGEYLSVTYPIRPHNILWQSGNVNSSSFTHFSGLHSAKV